MWSPYPKKETQSSTNSRMCHVCENRRIFNPIDAAKTNCIKALSVNNYLETLDTKYCLACLCETHLVEVDRKKAKKMFEKIKSINYRTKKYDDEKKFIVLKKLNSLGLFDKAINQIIFSYYNDPKDFKTFRRDTQRKKICNGIYFFQDERVFGSFHSFHGYSLKVFEQSTLNLQKHIELLYDCKTCDMSFLTRKSLLYHKKYECSLHCTSCGYSFYGEKDLKDHQDPKKIIKCKYCGKKCFGKKCLINHVKWSCQHRCTNCKEIIHGRFYADSICINCR